MNRPYDVVSKVYDKRQFVDLFYLDIITELLEKVNRMFSGKRGKTVAMVRQKPMEAANFEKISKKTLVKRGKSVYSLTA